MALTKVTNELLEIGVLADTTNFTDSILISQNASTGTLDAATNNTGLGDTVFAALTSGDNNTSIGADSSKALTSGGSNVAVGFAALEANTTASNNTAIGFTALLSNTTADFNTAVGSLALDANTTGGNNTAVGYAALSANVTGGNNVAVGNGALDASNHSFNTAVGDTALGASTSGQQNTAVGYQSLGVLTTSLYNTAIGLQSGRDCTTGSDNVFVGYRAGDGPSPSGSITTQSNNIVIGNNSSTNAYIKIDWTVTSDKRDKTDVEPLTMGLDLVNKLNPVTYRWDMRSDYKDGKPDGTHKKEKLCGGLLAQDVEVLEREYGYKLEDKTSILTDKNADGNYGLTYSKFVPVLINAVKELSAEVEELKAKLENK